MRHWDRLVQRECALAGCTDATCAAEIAMAHSRTLYGQLAILRDVLGDLGRAILRRTRA